MNANSSCETIPPSSGTPSSEASGSPANGAARDMVVPPARRSSLREAPPLSSSGRGDSPPSSRGEGPRFESQRSCTAREPRRSSRFQQAGPRHHLQAQPRGRLPVGDRGLGGLDSRPRFVAPHRVRRLRGSRRVDARRARPSSLRCLVRGAVWRARGDFRSGH